MPIVGPIVKDHNSTSAKTDVAYKYFWVGPIKGRPRTPYRRFMAQGHEYWTRQSAIDYLTHANRWNYDRLYAAAYDRFHSRALSSASMGVSLAEGRKSLEMIARRGKQIFDAARALKRFDFQGFTRALELSHISAEIRRRGGKQPQQKYFDPEYFKKSAVKSLSDTWLEYTFGWVPLVKDIGKAVEVLQQDFSPHTTVYGRVQEYIQYPAYADGGSSSKDVVVDYSLQVSGRIKVTNPNLLLANQLGFTNPAEILWDVVPFSFVVDWFLPVGAFLRSFKNEVGYDVYDRSVGFRANLTGLASHVSAPGGYKTVPTLPIRGFWVQRTYPTTFNRPSLLSRRRVPELSPWLAATSVSLAVQQLSGFLSRK